MVFLRVHKLVVACRWKSGPGSCQEARSGSPRAGVAKYREWNKDRPEPDATPDVNEAEIEDAAVTTTFEEATEGGIRRHSRPR
jgi:hypothetical protein